MKPLLERKRRARINTCLDELKDLMVDALQQEGESITKLEKADVLELTVRHLRKLKRQRTLVLNPGLDLDRFHAGYTSCAAEVNRCLSSTPGMDVAVSNRLMAHLGRQIPVAATATTAVCDPTQQPTVNHTAASASVMTAPGPLALTIHTGSSMVMRSPSSDPDQGYNSGRESITPSPPLLPMHIKNEPTESVWRPF